MSGSRFARVLLPVLLAGPQLALAQESPAEEPTEDPPAPAEPGPDEPSPQPVREEQSPEEQSPEEQSPEEQEAQPKDAPEQDDAAPADPEATSPSAREGVVPPRLLAEAPVDYPAGAQGSGQVVVAVTVDADGSLRDLEVRSGLTPALDLAALEAVRKFQFSPATRDGQPVAARVVVAVVIQPPPEEQAPEKPPPSPAEASEGSRSAESRHIPHESHEHPDDVHLQVTVHGERPLRTERRSSSDYFLHREVLEAAPRQEGAEVLRSVPGMTTFRTEGLALAHSYSLRGFDSDHGQDIEMKVGGLPVNLPSHIHGQGYADLGFLIGEVVDEVVVSEGVSDPRQGDFAVAGTIQVGLGVDEERRGLQARAGFGSFATQQYTLIWAPKLAERESVGAAQYTGTRGYGENRGGRSASGIVQHRFGEGRVRYRAVGFVHAARADSAGVLRQDDIDAGEVCFHCVYPHPSAQAQNSNAQRLMAGLFADYRGPEHANGTLGFFVGRDHFVNRQNFTGFVETSQLLPGQSGRGDLIEQRNTTSTLGITGRYRTEAFEPAPWAHGTLEVGVDGRFDTIVQQQTLLDASVRSQIWDRRVDATIQGVDTALWGDLDWQFGKRLQLRAGVRAAIFSYDIDDRLGNFAPLTRPQDQSLPGFRRTAMGTSVGPRSSIEVKATEWLRFLGAYGEGYRSPQARTLQEGERAPFAKVRSGDVGVRMRVGEPIDVTLTGYYTHLSSDVAFDTSEGRLERIGPTQRLGGVAYALARPAEWLLASLSVTYVHATLLEPPPATAEEPDPPFQKGQLLPFVPPLVVRLDAAAKAPLVRFREGPPLIGRLGVGATYLAPRPLPYNQKARPIPLLDASATLLYGPFDLGISGFNLLDLDYAAREFFFVSQWDQDAVPSRVPARHIAAGAPLTVMATLGVTL